MTKTIEQLQAKVAELEKEKKELQALLDFDNARLDQIEDELEDVEYLGPYVEGIKVLKTQLAAAQEENAHWQKATAENENKWIDACDQLAAEQLNNKLLREALGAVIKVHGYESGIPVEAVSTPANTEALDAYVKQKIKEYS